MRAKNMLVLFVAVLPLLSTAQNKAKKLHWYNTTQCGWLIGSNQQTYSVETINGIAFKKYDAGIGIALDNYGYRSFPVFADLRYTLLVRSKDILQVYGNPGINLPPYSQALKHHIVQGGDLWHTMHSSFYGEAGLSYSRKLLHRLYMTAGAGYNYKTFKYTEHNYVGEVGVTDLKTAYTYHYSKYVLRLGISFR